nr:hypothetical protein [Tanacetum cinerariifolium]
HEVNEIRAEKIACVANPLALVAQQQPVYHPQTHPTHYTQNSSTRSQQAATRNRGKAIVNSYNPSMIKNLLWLMKMMKSYYKEKMLLCKQEEAGIQLNAEQADRRDDTDDDELEDQELEAHYIYMAQLQEVSPDAADSEPIFDDEPLQKDNSPRINRNTGYENQRIGNVVGARETIGSTVVQKSRIQYYNCKEFGHVARECQKPKRVKDVAYHREKMILYQELEAYYMYMAQLQEVSLDAADSGPIFDSKPLQKVSNDDHYNVFAIKSKHPEQSESIHDTYPIAQDEHNVIIDSLDMSYDREQID